MARRYRYRNNNGGRINKKLVAFVVCIVLLGICLFKSCSSSIKKEDGTGNLRSLVESVSKANAKDSWEASNKRPIYRSSDEIVEVGTIEYPFYLRKGDKLHVEFSSEEGVNVSLWNYDKGAKLKDLGKQKNIDSEIDIPVSAIYYLQVKNGARQYCSYLVEKSSATYEDFIEDFKVKKVVVKDGVSPKDPRAIKFQVIEPTSLFYEPKQITLKKLFHFSGSNRSVIPVKIPKGATDIICRIRVSSSRNSRVGDGELHNDVNDKISRFIDNFSLKRQTARMIFDDLNRPHTEHDYTVDLYVFNEQKWARGFQTGDYDCKWQKHYDVSSSIIGTQSCNDLIHVAGKSMVYLGFEGTHSFDDTYLWLECEFMKPVDRYSRISYKR